MKIDDVPIRKIFELENQEEVNKVYFYFYNYQILPNAQLRKKNDI